MEEDSVEEYRLQERRFLVAAVVWVVGTAAYYAIGGLDIGFAVIIGVTGGVSALAIALLWGHRARRSSD